MRVGIGNKLLLCFLVLLITATNSSAQQASQDLVELSAVGAGPREMQEATRQSIARAYGRAWETLSRALAENREDLLDSAFLGSARDALVQLVRHQKATGIRQRYVDRGHKAEVLFYSPEGLSVQLRDRAQFELQVLDGESVVHREQVTVSYIALLSPTEVTWKVRVLQAVPETTEGASAGAKPAQIFSRMRAPGE
ncbi:MAG: hypothetical protein AB7O65_00455 [Candidatus Korobacteraceae bacterium]